MMPIIPPTAPIKQKDVEERYGVVYCRLCNMAVAYCKGHAPADPPAADGAETWLSKRIREARQQQGGR
jgi:hypothetical protein